MHFSRNQLAVLALALSQCQSAWSATILADTNRDGVVDVTGTSDSVDKQTWTADRGALFLANIGDTDGRCSDLVRSNMSHAEIDDCNDASDNILRNSLYLAPVATLPDDTLSSSATGSVNVTGETAAEFVRVFVREGDSWTYVGSDFTFDAEALRAGLELGVDARDIRRPEGWDGRATLQFTVVDGDVTTTDAVAMRVAPVLTHHHAQAAERVFVTGARGSSVQNQFVSDLRAHAEDAGIEEPLYEFQGQDIWTQDFFEPGYSSIPGPDGPIVIRILIRSAQSFRPAGREIFTSIRNAGVGSVQHPRDGDINTIDSHGNLETIPPYTHNGTSYPAGRIIMGAWEGTNPRMHDFFVAQETQTPLVLDTAWLVVGHVDEFLQFLPSDSERGWVLMADDTIAGMNILRNASEAGFGGERALSRPDGPGCVPKSTIDEELNRGNFTEIQEHAAQRIEGNIQLIKEATGITDAEIFRVPALFWPVDDMWSCYNEGSRIASATDEESEQGPLSIIEAAGPRVSQFTRLGRRQSFTQVAAHYPGTINGIVLSDSYVLAPDPWGPIIEGRDILKEAVSAAYEEAGHTVYYMDDYFSHHIGLGEVHCGSNTWRNTDTPWW